MSYLKSRIDSSLFVESVPVEVEPWRKALMDAAEYIRVHGHCKGRGVGVDRSACAIGSLHMIKATHEAHYAALSKLQTYTYRHFGSLVTWNDHPDTTPSMVIAAMEAAARS